MGSRFFAMVGCDDYAAEYRAVSVGYSAVCPFAGDRVKYTAVVARTTGATESEEAFGDE